MRYLTAKLFHKNKFVKVKMYNPDGTMETFYEVPKGNQINLRKSERTFILIKENAILENGIPTYYFNSEFPLSLNITKEQKEQIEYTPEKIFTAIDTVLLQKVFNAYEGNDLNLGLIISIAIGVLMLIGFFLIYKQTQAIQNILTTTQQITAGGI